MLTSSGFLDPASPFQPHPGGWAVVFRAAHPARRCRPPHRSRLTIPGVRRVNPPFRADPGMQRASPLFQAVTSTPAGKPVGCAPRGLSRSSAWCRCARPPSSPADVLTTVALDTSPQSGPDTKGLLRWTLAPGGSTRGSGCAIFRERFASARQDGRRRSRKRAGSDGCVG